MMNRLIKLCCLFLTTIALIVGFQSKIVWGTIPIAQQRVVVSQNSQNLEYQAERLYRQGEYDRAIASLKTAIEQYQQQSDLVGGAIAMRNLALIYQKTGAWERADNILARAEALIAQIDNNAQSSLLAQILEVKGQIELSRGRSQNALETWKQATAIYQGQNNLTGLTQTKIYQARALQTLGLYSQAIKTLTEVEQLETEPDTEVKAQALISLGNVLSQIGKYAESEQMLTRSLTISQQLNDPTAIAESFLGLGNNARLKSEPEAALEFYQQALDIASDSNIRLRAKLNRLNTLVGLQDIAAANNEAKEIERILTSLSPSQTTIQGKVSLARQLLKLNAEPSQIARILVTAIAEARNLGISRVEADALGVLGNLYERARQWQEAQQVTERALLTAQSINAKELGYQWHWQLGRILRAQGNTSDAIAAYIQATNELQSLRSDLVTVSSNLQYSFSEQIEPVYRELATLLLQPNASQADLDRARKTIESLQVAELDNFFRDACLNTQPVQIDRLDPTAAILYTIVIENRLEVIAAIPGQPLRHYSNNLPPSEIEIVFTSATSQISSPRRLNLELFQQAYDWLIRPFEDELEANNIQTLVFVPDRLLRNFTPAALHDGEKYLIEKYSVAVAPSLQLVELQEREPYRQEELLLAGLSQPRQGFSSLPGVRQEIEQIQPLFASEVLFNDNFTESNFDRYISQTPFKFVHLATHGQFSSDAEETFVLTWDERINIDELSRLLRGDSKQLRPIELLVLSACETATGDRYSALGLAGIAVRGGARSTVASLWSVSDVATVALMTNFYQELARENITKAEALRRAQVKILNDERFSHPFYWSAFILVGNWQ